ncbi:YncE family protein [Desulfosporosinus sp. SB140]|uniref:YncE family protein n=1 Tax=Desulfosporosinus paludis TaxID=3115649 RepID=UPI00388F5FF4
MAILTTGIIKNNSISGVRLSSMFLVKVTNHGLFTGSLQIRGFYGNVHESAKTEYVLDILTVEPKSEMNKTYYAQFDSFEFRFITSSDTVGISAWGKDPSGNLTVSYPVLPEELMVSATGSQIYVPNFSGNNVAVVESKTNSLKGSVAVGIGPFGIGINALTNRIYVANYSSNMVSVVEGTANTVIANVNVGTNPMGVGVNSATNRIYVTNRGSSNVSVIEGNSNAVIANILVGAFPEGINVNPTTNRIYITNEGNNSLSVINGSTNTVIATIDLGR